MLETSGGTLWVAQITKDHLFDPNIDERSRKDKLFDYEAMCDWWGWHDLPDQDGWLPKEKTTFKLYDDDGEHYYSGWLRNDDWCIVQQFVLDWAKADSGCTTIKVHKPIGEGEYVQEIG